MKLAPFSRPLIFGNRSLRFVPGILCVLSAVLVGGMASVQAQNITWSNTGTDYNAGASWVGGVAPGSGNRTVFVGAANASFQPNLSANITNDRLTFNGTNASGYILSAASGSLRLNSNSAIFSENTSGTNTISAPIILGSPVANTATISQTAGGTLVLSGNISSANAITGLSLSGASIFTLSGSNSYSGNTTLVTSGATLNINSATALGAGGAGTALVISATQSINNTSGAAITLTNNNNINHNTTGTLTFLGNSANSSLSFGTGTLTLNGGSRTLNTTAGGTLTIGRLAADTTARGFTHGGTGTLVIQNAADASYGGTTTLGATTTTIIGNKSAFGTGSLVITAVASGPGATLQASADLSGANAITNAWGIGTASNGISTISGSNNITLSGNFSGTTNTSTLSIQNNIAGGALLTLGNIAINTSASSASTLNLIGTGSTTINGTISNGVSSAAQNFAISNSGVTTINGNVTNTGTFGYTGAGTLNLNGNVSGPSGVTINNAAAIFTQGAGSVISGTGTTFTLTSGNATLAGANTYTGATQVNGGTLTLSGGLNNSSVTVNGGVLNQTSTGSISGTGTTFILTSGNATLAGANTYTGATTITAGTLSISSDANLSGTNSALVFNGGTLQITGTALTSLNATRSTTFTAAKVVGLNIADAANTFTVSQALTQTTGGLTKSGNGTLNLTSSGNTYTGTTTIAQGVLALGAGASLGNLGGSDIVLGGTSASAGSTATLTIDPTATVSLDASVTYSANAGSDNLGATISGGTIALNSNSRVFSVADSAAAVDLTVSSVLGNGTAASAVIKQGAGTMLLSGVNTYTGATTIQVGTLLAGGNVAVSTDGVFGNRSGDISLGRDVTTAAGENVALLTNGAFTISRDVRVHIGVGNTTAFTSTLGGNTDNTSTFSGAIIMRKDLTISQVATTGANALQITGGISGESTSANKTVTFAGPGAINVSGTAIADGAGGGTMAVNITGGNTTFSNANTYTGATTISAGTLRIGNGGTTGSLSTSSAITNNGTLVFNRTDTLTQGTNFNSVISGSGSLIQAGSGNLVLTGANTYTGATTISAGTLQIGAGSTSGNISASSAITNNGTLAFNRSNTITQGTDFNSVISGTGSVVQAGSGTLILSGNNTYSGATTINGGTLSIAAITNGGVAGALGNSTNAAGNLVLGGGTLEYTGTANGSTDRNFTLTAGTASGISVANSTVALTISGTAATTTGGLIKSGAGTLVLSANNTYTGATTINGGTLQIGNGSTTGSLSASSAITNNGTLAFNRGNTITQGTDFNSVISGTGALIQAGSGTLILSGANTYNGTTTISAGTLQIGNGSTTGSLSASSAITNNGTLAFNRSNTITISNTISGSGNLTQLGTSTLTLGGTSDNTYTGTTTVSNGTLTLDKTSGVVAVGGDLVLNGSSKLLYVSGKNEQIANTASVTINGSQSVFNGSSWGNATGAIGITETIGSLTVRDGQFNTGTGSNWTVTGAGVFDGSTGDTRFLGFSGSRISFNSLSLTAMTGTTIITDSDSFVMGGGNAVVTTLAVGSGGLTLNGSTLGLNKGTGSFAGSRLILNGNITTTGSSASFIASNTGTVGISNILLSDVDGSVVTRTITTGSGANLTISVPITNGNATTAGITKDGGGTLTLTGANTYNGATTINGGTLSIAAITNGGVAGALGNSTNAEGNLVLGGGVLEYTGTANGSTDRNFTLTAGTTSGISVANSTVALTISGTAATTSGGLTKSGAGTLILTGANTYTGATTISTGTLQIGNNGTTGSLSASSAITNNGTLNFNRSDDLSQGTDFSSAAITGTGSLIKNGAGSLTLNAANTYSGATTVNSGTLLLNGTNSASSITVNTGATLAGSGTSGASTTTTINSGAKIAPGTSPGILTVGNLILNGNATYTWEMADATGAAGTGWDQINATGLLTIGANATSKFTIAITSAAAPSNWNFQASNQSWDILRYGTQSGFSSSFFTLNSTAFAGDLSPDSSWSLTDTGSALRLTYSYTATAPTYSGGTGNWSTGFSPAISNSTNVTFVGAGGVATNDIASGTLSTIGSLTFDGSNSYTLAANSGSAGFNSASALAITGNITNNSTATQTINLATSYAGSRTINANTGNFVIGGNMSIGNGASLTVLGSNSTTISGAISGLGGLTKNGTGTLTLSGSNTYSGGTSLLLGEVVIASANAISTASTLSTSGGTLSTSLASITLSNNLAINSTAVFGSNTNTGNFILSGTLNANSSSRQITVTNAATTVDVTGVIAKNGQVTTYTKGGNGTLILSGGSNTWDGGLTLTAGTLQLNNANNGGLGTGGNLTLNGGTLQALNASRMVSNTVNLGASSTISGSQDLALNGTMSGSTVNSKTLTNNIDSGKKLTLGNVNINSVNATPTGLTIAGTGDTLITGVVANGNANANTFTITNTGTTTLSGNNTYTGATTISAGTLQIGNGGTTGSLSTSSSIVNNGALAFNRSDTITQGTDFANSISGTGNLTQAGSGTLVLTGANTYNGSTTISAGTLSIASTSALGSTSAIALGNTGVLSYTGSTTTLNRTISVTSGTGTIQNTGGGLLTLSGALTKDGTTLTLAGGSNGITVSGAISGSNANSDLVIDGGTTTLTNANNTYNGPTFIINGATLNASVAGALPTSTLTAVTINGSSTLALGASQSVASLSGTSGSSVNLNANTLTINGSATTTYSGGISGTGNLVKNGSGSQTLAGATTFNGTTTINSGTLQAATANALANTSQVVLNSGGSFLVTADDAIGTNTDIELNGGTLAFGAAGYDGYVGALTLSANSTIDLGTSGNGVLLRFTNINWNNPNALLSIYNWTGNTEYSGNPGGGLDQVVIGNATTTPLSPSQLQQINFYSGIEQSSFIANAFQITSGNYNREIIAVPEPETYLTGVILLLGGTIYLFRRAKNREGHRPAWPKFLLGIRRTTPRYHLAQKPPDPHRADT